MHNFGYIEDGQEGSFKDIHLWRRILRYCAMHKAGLSVAVVLSLIVTGATLMLPRLMQLGIDNYVIADTLSAEVRISGLGKIFTGYAGLVILVFVTTFIQITLLEWVGQTIMHRLRQDLFAHLLQLDLSFFNNQPVGRLITRLTNDIQNMHEMFTSVMVTLFNDFLKLIGIFCFLYMMNVRLALLMSLFIPLALGITYIFSRFARKIFRAIRSQLARINTFLAEALGAVSIIQIYGQQAASLRTFHQLTGGYLKRTLSQIRLFGTFMPLTELMSTTATALILWYGGGEVLHNQLSLGQLVAFLSYMRLFFQPLRELSQKYSIVQSAMASAERIFELLDIKVQGVVREPVYSCKELNGAITFDKVTFGYTEDQEVIQGISLDIAQGETVALVGSTGSGKSTLISLLVRFYDPDSGTVFIDGKDISHFPLHGLRQKVGIIMQDIFILPDTVEANIILDAPLDRDKLSAILEQTGLQAFIDKLNKGLQTDIGEGGLPLSVGEKQLLSFARALYRDPILLILDEATASIDTESENLLEQAVAAVFKDRTSMIIAHRLSTIRRVDRIIVMDKGRVVEQGSHEELMEYDSAYSKLVKLDLQSSP